MGTDLSTAPFTDALAQGRIVHQCCVRCGAAQRLARTACTTCGADATEWRESRGTGTVFGITVVARAPSEAFRALVPYGLALVDLDEGARLMGHAPVDLRIGERVRAEVFSLAGSPLLRFVRLASTDAAGGAGNPPR